MTIIAKMAVSLDKEAMQQLGSEQRALLDIIDELRVLGLGKFVHLPQIIVIGDQSSGKSSVLEAISRVRFPVQDGLCTRFATELVLRQSPTSKIDVKIKNESILRDLSNTSFSKDDLPEIIEKAKERMGLDGNGSVTFSEDVLRLEIFGPDMPQLTLVDLPGFYHNQTETQDAAGVAIVNRLAEKYMKQENSIILAIVSAGSELAAQKVLHEAAKHDRARERTLGIITKPDKVEENSHNEKTYLQLAQNEEVSQKLALGWHVLRNRAHKESLATDAERDETEKLFFRSSIWSAISFRNRGIETLREKLSQVLLDHIKRKLPALISRIEELVRQHETRLRELGEQRVTPQDLRKYLTKISSRFHDLSLDAVRGNYVDEFFGGLYTHSDASPSYASGRVKKLRALVRDMNRAFNYVLSLKGERRRIQWNDEHAENGGTVNTERSKVPEYLEPLVALYEFEEPESVSIEALSMELEALASENQGTELPGSANDRVAISLFRDQSRPWEAIAHRHMELVLDHAKMFAEKLVYHITGPDQRTADAILNSYIDPYFERKRTVLREKVAELLRHYQKGLDPQPIYANFYSRVDRRKNDRLAKQVADEPQTNHPSLFDKSSGEGLDSERVTQVLVKVSDVHQTSEFGTEQIINNMQAYYDISLGIFVDNIIVLALENCLITDIPDGILTPDKVHDMSDDVVQKLASESVQVRREREQLEGQLEKLKKGLAACQAHRPRVREPSRSPAPPPRTPAAHLRASLAPITTQGSSQHDSKQAAPAGTLPIRLQAQQISPYVIPAAQPNASANRSLFGSPSVSAPSDVTGLIGPPTPSKPPVAPTSSLFTPVAAQATPTSSLANKSLFATTLSLAPDLIASSSQPPVASTSSLFTPVATQATPNSSLANKPPVASTSSLFTPVAAQATPNSSLANKPLFTTSLSLAGNSTASSSSSSANNPPTSTTSLPLFASARAPSVPSGFNQTQSVRSTAVLGANASSSSTPGAAGNTGLSSNASLGTARAPYKPTDRPWNDFGYFGPSSIDRHCHIGLQPEYQAMSTEELRLVDYEEGRRTSADCGHTRVRAN